MTDYLRTRIAAAIMDSCHGVYMDDAVDAADAVIRELGLRRERLGEAEGYPHPQTRYVTDWTAE